MATYFRARFLAQALVVACAALAALGGLARGESVVWTERTSGDLTTLAYGPLDPNAIPVLLLSCFNEMEIAVLDVHQEVEGSPGDPITIEISSGQGQAPVQGEVAKNRDTGKTFAEASDVKVKPILEVLGGEGPLSVSIGETSVKLSDAGRADAVAQFGKDCKLY